MCWDMRIKHLIWLPPPPPPAPSGQRCDRLKLVVRLETEHVYGFIPNSLVIPTERMRKHFRLLYFFLLSLDILVLAMLWLIKNTKECASPAVAKLKRLLVSEQNLCLVAVKKISHFHVTTPISEDWTTKQTECHSAQ